MLGLIKFAVKAVVYLGTTAIAVAKWRQDYRKASGNPEALSVSKLVANRKQAKLLQQQTVVQSVPVTPLVPNVSTVRQVAEVSQVPVAQATVYPPPPPPPSPPVS